MKAVRSAAARSAGMSAGPHTAGPDAAREDEPEDLLLLLGFRKVESERDIGQVGVLFQRHL